MEVFTSIHQLEAAVGRELGPTEWTTVDQGAVDAFADLTEDHNWIHVDRERARDSAFGGTIAHGFLTLSLLPKFSRSLMALDQVPAVRLNYGLDSVRFPHPVPTGSRIRARGRIVGLPQVPAGHQLRVKYVIDVEGVDKPACVAELIVLLRQAAIVGDENRDRPLGG